MLISAILKLAATPRQQKRASFYNYSVREARGVAEIQWAAVEAAHQKNSKTNFCLNMERERGIGPP
jgi:hypothetical protein